MGDHSRGAFGAHASPSARTAAIESEIETALAAAEAATELSAEAAEVLRRHVRREVRRLKLAGGAEAAARRLRAYLADTA